VDNYKKELNDIIQSISNLETINLSDIPDIELYMDQVTTFIDDKLKSYKRHTDDKILTKTMINNYTKDRLLPPSNRKKYSKNHMILLILIYHLKSILSISDIRTLLNSIDEIPESYSNSKGDSSSTNNIEKIYNEFIAFQKSESENVFSSLNINQNPAEEDISSLVSTIIMLLIKAETQKMLAEKLIDHFLIAESTKKK
jgi:hypothetical protein